MYLERLDDYRTRTHAIHSPVSVVGPFDLVAVLSCADDLHGSAAADAAADGLALHSQTIGPLHDRAYEDLLERLVGWRPRVVVWQEHDLPQVLELPPTLLRQDRRSRIPP
jgi:hypothetical protein